MATKIIMPQLGESVVDGTVGEWLKQVGDAIEEYEPIVRVSTDKVDTEVPAPAAGVLLKIHIAEGETVDSGVVLGLIGEANESTDDQTAKEAQPTATRLAEPTPVKNSTRTQSGRYTGHMTPVVARMAAEHELDLSQIEGSGRDGRITKKDVLAYMQQAGQGNGAATATDDIAPWEQPVDGDLFKPSVEYKLDDAPQQPAPTQAARPPAAKPPAKAPDVPQDVPGELVQLTPMRRSIAEHMVRSQLQTAPHVTTVFEVDLSAVVAHRAANKAAFEQKGVKLTFTPYFVAACAQSLSAYPALNARWTANGIYYQHVTHVGIAVALDDGLIVPVIKNAGDYNLLGLARQVNDLAARARKRDLTADEVRNGTFSITNHGVNGSLFATPIINQPQSAILGVGAIEKRVKVVADALAVRPCAYLSLTFDHRLIDGATADQFMSHLKRQLEGWPQ